MFQKEGYPKRPAGDREPGKKERRWRGVEWQKRNKENLISFNQDSVE